MGLEKSEDRGHPESSQKKKTTATHASPFFTAPLPMTQTPIYQTAVMQPPGVGYSGPSNPHGASMWVPPVGQPFFQYPAPYGSQTVYLPMQYGVPSYYGQPFPTPTLIPSPQPTQSEAQPHARYATSAPGMAATRPADNAATISHTPPAAHASTTGGPSAESALAVEFTMFSLMPNTKLPEGIPFCPPGVSVPPQYAQRPGIAKGTPAVPPASLGAERPFQCTFCHDSFIADAHLTDHIASVHSVGGGYDSLGSYYATQIRTQAEKFLGRAKNIGSATFDELCAFILNSAEDGELKRCASLEFVETVITADPSNFIVFQYSPEDMPASGVTSSSIQPFQLRFASTKVDYRMRDLMTR